MTLLLLAAATLLQDKDYDLKLEWKPKAGHSVREDHKRHLSMKMQVSMAGQVVQEQNDQERFAFKSSGKILEVNEGEVVKEERTFEKAVRIEDGEEVATGFQGKKVVRTRNDEDEWVYAYEDGVSLADEDLDAAANAFLGKSRKNADGKSRGFEVFGPGKPVKVGQSWTPDLQAIAKDLFRLEEDDAIDREKSSATMTLQSVEKRGASEFGKIEGAIKLVVQKMGPLRLKQPFIAEIKVRMDVCIDGTAPDGVMNVGMSMKGKSPVDSPDGMGQFDISLDMDGSFDAKRETSE